MGGGTGEPPRRTPDLSSKEGSVADESTPSDDAQLSLADLVARWTEDEHPDSLDETGRRKPVTGRGLLGERLRRILRGEQP
jgi:hypothetical protein